MITERYSLCMVRSGYLLQTLQTVERMGINPADIYEPAWLSEIGSLDVMSSRPAEEWNRLMQQAQQHTPEVDIALKMAEFINPWDVGPVGFITMASRTLREAAMALVQFYRLLNDVYKLDGGVTHDSFRVELIAQGMVTSVFLERLTLGLVVRHARWLSKRDDLVFDASFTFDQPEPQHLLEYQRIFGGHLTFNAKRSGLSGPLEYGNLTVADSPSSDQVRDMLRSRLLTELEAVDQSNSGFMQRVERVVQSRLELGQTGLEEVAAELGVSSRTLQNRLEESGLSYRDLLDRLRHAQAVVFVSNPSVSLIQAAQMLGFATQSTFQRAFKRWTGMTPGDYRRRGKP
jgi:AraC-like DNA-binding protein